MLDLGNDLLGEVVAVIGGFNQFSMPAAALDKGVYHKVPAMAA